MKMRKAAILLVSVLMLVSCVPKKDLIYFQGTPKQTGDTEQLNSYGEPYKLQVNDILHIKIKGADETLVSVFNKEEVSRGQAQRLDEQNLYFTSYTINREGTIRMPFIGEINVLGYTEDEVRELIENKLKEYFKNTDDAFVTVKLAGVRFTVLGEVNSPGTRILFQNQVNIVEAIANAGDITLTGNRKRVVILRKRGNNSKKIVLDLTNANSLNSNSFYIQPNDMIYVEPLKQKSWGTGATGTQTLTTIVTIVSLITSAVLISRSFNTGG